MNNEIIYTTPAGDILTASPKTDYQPISGTTIAALISASGIGCQCVNVAVAPQLVHYDMNLTNILEYNETKLSKVIKAIGARHHSAATFASSKIADFGIDIARNERSDVYLRTGIYTESFNNASRNSAAIGVDTSGNNVILDIATAPHVLIAGTTGSGKSVLLNSLIVSLLYKATPATAQFIMIDPKQVELSNYSRLPHLYKPIVTDANNAVSTLADVCAEMYRRYSLLAEQGYKQLADAPHLFPRLYIVIDELADLMLTSKRAVETSIVRIAQLGRAAGIHLIVATQRPTVNVVTGLIKANIPCKIALAVSNITDSMTILNHGGAEKLTGRGDAIIKTADSIIERRFQTYFTPDHDINAVIDHYYMKSCENAPKRGFLRIFKR